MMLIVMYYHGMRTTIMKWNNKQIYYGLKDEFELSERHMAYYYALAGFSVGFILGIIL